MTVIGLRDRLFAHTTCVGGPFPFPNLPFRWDRRTTDQRRLTVYTDDSLAEVTHSRDHGAKVAWLLESPLATRYAYEWMLYNFEQFDRVLTFEQGLLEALPNSIFVPLGGCWIHESERRVHAKTHNVSIIASAKRSMVGQKLRHKIIRKYGHLIDAIVGHGYAPIDNKVHGLANFRYSIIIENCRRNYYFSEKLIDCFVTGTIPIYWGCPSIGLFFDKSGMICFEHISELKSILHRIGADDYESRQAAVRRNLKTARQFVYPEYAFWKAVKYLAA
jgi:hypothetical protein